MDVNDIKRKLNNINWNFDFNVSYSDDILYPFDCRKHYSYPATFIPEIPFSLIETLSQKGDIVLDPFGGIGTTFIQSLLLERIPYSFDINPVASNVCEALYQLLNPDLDHNSLEQDILSMCDDYDKAVDYSKLLSKQQKNMHIWFEKETYNKICFLISQYNEMQSEPRKTIVKLIISGILPTVSSQNKGWAYLADNVKPKDDEYKSKPVFDIFKSRTKLLFSEVTIHLNNCSNSFESFYSETQKEQRIFRTSITGVNIPNVDLIITSPPYPKMIDYVKSQRITFDFLNESYKSYVPLEVGARCRRAKRNTLEDYLKSMGTINSKLVELLKSNGYLCLVLPDFPDSDERKKTIDSMVREYEELGLTPVYTFKRYIPSHRRTISIQWASLVNESLLIFRKGN